MISYFYEYIRFLEKVPWCKDTQPICKRLLKPPEPGPIPTYVNAQRLWFCLVSADLRKKCPFACDRCFSCGIVTQVKGICESDLEIKDICPNECKLAKEDIQGITNSSLCFLAFINLNVLEAYIMH